MKYFTVDAEGPAQVVAGSHQQFLTFGLGDEVYGIGIHHIREIIEYHSLTAVPLMPDCISGVINLRGNVLPVVNLARRFGQTPREINKRSSIIILEIGVGEDERLDVGIVVDVVSEVIELGVGDIVTAPSFGARIRTDFIEGMGKINDQLMILLDISKVLSIEELSSMIEVVNEPAPALAGKA